MLNRTNLYTKYAVFACSVDPFKVNAETDASFKHKGRLCLSIEYESVAFIFAFAIYDTRQLSDQPEMCEADKCKQMEVMLIFISNSKKANTHISQNVSIFLESKFLC